MYNFSRKKMSSYPCLSTPKNGLLAQKMAFFVVTNTFLLLRRPSKLFYAVTSGTNFSWHPNNSFSTINILVTPLLGNKKNSILAEKKLFLTEIWMKSFLFHQDVNFSMEILENFCEKHCPILEPALISLVLLNWPH